MISRSSCKLIGFFLHRADFSSRKYAIYSDTRRVASATTSLTRLSQGYFAMLHAFLDQTMWMVSKSSYRRCSTLGSIARVCVIFFKRTCVVKVKFSHSRYGTLGPELMPV